MQKLTGTVPLHAAIMVPSQHVEQAQTQRESAIARGGLLTILVAVAAGPTSSVNSRSAPITWTAREAMTARTTRKRTERRDTGTPRATASSGSKVLNRRGR